MFFLSSYLLDDLFLTGFSLMNSKDSNGKAC